MDVECREVLTEIQKFVLGRFELRAQTTSVWGSSLAHSMQVHTDKRLVDALLLRVLRARPETLMILIDDRRAVRAMQTA